MSSKVMLPFVRSIHCPHTIEIFENCPHQRLFLQMGVPERVASLAMGFLPQASHCPATSNSPGLLVSWHHCLGRVLIYVLANHTNNVASMQQLGRVWVVVKVDEPIERPVCTFRGQCGGGIIPYDPVSQLCSMAGHRCSLMHQSGRWKLHGNPTFLSRKLTILHQIQG